jgi:hypothetical protein
MIIKGEEKFFFFFFVHCLIERIDGPNFIYEAISISSSRFLMA